MENPIFLIVGVNSMALRTMLSSSSESLGAHWHLAGVPESQLVGVTLGGCGWPGSESLAVSWPELLGPAATAANAVWSSGAPT
jgi:hypothetical protein